MTTKRIPQHFINELLARTDIVELVAHRIQLKKRGNNHFACCPFHQEKSPSFSVNQKKQMYYCFGCKASGNAIGFLMEHDGMEFLEAIDALAGPAGMEVPKQTHQGPSDYEPMVALMDQSANYYQQTLSQHQNAVNYLKERGLDQKIIQHYRIGYAAPGWDNLQQLLGKTDAKKKLMIKAGLLIAKDDHRCYDRFRERIIFPIRNTRGQVIGFGGRSIGDQDPKYLNSPESTLFQKRAELYGLFEARQANRKLERLLIVEGYMDVISLAQFGISYGVATLGTAATIRHIHSMLRYTSELVFCFDGDNAGKQAAWHALEIMLPVMRDNITVRFMLMPPKEDPDSLIRKIGLETFEQEIHKAKSFTDFFYETLEKQYGNDRLEEKAKCSQYAMTLLSKMPAGVLQSMMIDRLAQMVHLPTEKLHGFVAQSKQPPLQRERQRSNTTPRAPAAKITGLIEQILTLIIQHPEVASTIANPEKLKALSVEGSDFLIEMIETAVKNPKINTGALLSLWKDKPEEGILADLAMKEVLIEEGLWANEIQGFINRLFEQQAESELQLLMNMAKQQKLDQNGKLRLMELLKY